jgi:hypothetical protein
MPPRRSEREDEPRVAGLAKVKVACSPLVPEFFCAACKTELDHPEPPCPTCGGMVREIFADVDTWTFSDVQTGIKAREGGGVGEVRPYLEQSTKINGTGTGSAMSAGRSSSTARTTITGNRGSTARRASAHSTRRGGTPTRPCTGSPRGAASPRSRPPRTSATTSSRLPDRASRPSSWKTPAECRSNVIEISPRDTEMGVEPETAADFSGPAGSCYAATLS